METDASVPVRTRSSAPNRWYRLAMLLLSLGRCSPAHYLPRDALRAAMMGGLALQPRVT